VNLRYTGAFDLTMSGRLTWPVLETRLAALWGAALENIHGVVAAGRS